MSYCIYVGIAIIVLGILLLTTGIVMTKKQAVAEAEQETVQETEIVQEIEEPVQEEQPEEQPKADEPADEAVTDIAPEIKRLIENYYAAYASGDTDKLETLASPVSELEKSYIKLMSGYTDSTKNIQCYIRDGLNDGEYAVSATGDIKLNGIDTKAPGMDFFYVRTKDDGSYYIDNLYCSFNLSVHVMDTDSKVMEFIADCEEQNEFRQLQETIQAEYEQIVASDEQLADKLLKEIPKAVDDWMADLASIDKDSGIKYGIKEGTTITASDSYNVRDSMSNSGKKIGTVKKGNEMKIVKHYDGWTKIKWDGKTGYIKTELLSKDE